MNCIWCLLSSPFYEKFRSRHIAWGVNWQIANFLSHPSSALFQTNLLTFRATQFIPVLHAVSLVSCHNILSFLLYSTKWFSSGISYFPSKIVVFLVDSLYAKAIVAAKSCAALSVSLQEWICVFGNRSSEPRLRTTPSLSVVQLDLKFPSF
jgi:hypothetical protein